MLKGIITYDGIDIKDKRRSSPFPWNTRYKFIYSTVMDNIKYGKLDATDEEAIEAAKLAGAMIL